MSTPASKRAPPTPTQAINASTYIGKSMKFWGFSHIRASCQQSPPQRCPSFAQARFRPFQDTPTIARNTPRASNTPPMRPHNSSRALQEGPMAAPRTDQHATRLKRTPKRRPAGSKTPPAPKFHLMALQWHPKSAPDKSPRCPRSPKNPPGGFQGAYQTAPTSQGPSLKGKIRGPLPRVCGARPG